MRVLCLCNNGVHLTAEIDYALEGAVDIVTAGGTGGDGNGGEAGLIHSVAYATKTTTVAKVVTIPSVTRTVTELSTVTQLDRMFITETLTSISTQYDQD